MSIQRRKFSVEQKLQIIQEADTQGITQTLRKHNLSHSVYQRWKHQFNSGGAALLKLQHHKIDPAFKALEDENARLKKIIGNQALEPEFKTELLKKSEAYERRLKGPVKSYILRGIATRHVLRWSELGSSSFYYKKSGGPKGIQHSTHAINKNGEFFENKIVVGDIEKTLHQEFCCYDYRNMTGELRDMGWIINHKKVYRLLVSTSFFMVEDRPEPFKRDFIRFRSPQAIQPLQYLWMDIKYVHIHGWQSNALLLTVIDMYSRKVLIHMLRSSIKKGDVLVMLSLMLLEYKAEGMTLRNDNGSQFIATAVRAYLKEKGILQEFSHVATPEDNAYIEALHSNLQREVIDRFEFDSIYHAQLIIDRYYKWYNEKRRHGSLAGKTPNAVYSQYLNPNPFDY